MMDPKTLTTISNEDLRAHLAELETQVKGVIASAREFEAQASLQRNEGSRLQQRIDTIRNELDRRNRPAPEPKISEHALLRYIERAHGVDLELLKGRIMTPHVVAAVLAGASTVTVDGIKFLIRDNVIVTVLGEEQKPKPKTVKRGREDIPASEEIAAGIAEYEDDRAAAH